MVIVGQRVQMECLHQLLLGASHPGGPVQLGLGGFAGQGVCCLVVGDQEKAFDLLSFCRHLFLGDLLELLLQVAHLQHLQMGAGLGGKHSKIRIQVQHTPIGIP